MKRKVTGFLMLLLAVLMLTGAIQGQAAETDFPLEKFLWQDSDGKYSCSYSEAQIGNEYMLFVVEGMYSDLENVESDRLISDLLYINQKTAESSSVVFSGFVPSEEKNSTVIISGSDMEPKILGYISHDYFKLKGYVLDDQGMEEIEDSMLISYGTTWEEVKALLPESAYAHLTAENTGDLYLPIALDWSQEPVDFGNQREGKVIAARAQTVSVNSSIPFGIQSLLGTVQVNLTVLRQNSIPVELTVSKAKTVYQQGEAFGVDDLLVKAIYDDNTVRNVTGWTTNVDQLIPSESGEYILLVSYTEGGYTASRNVTLYVQGEEGQDLCKVTFDTRGGSYIPPVFTAGGTVLTLPEEPEKNGYTFAGWYCDRKGNVPFDPETAVMNDTTLYAFWTDKTRPALVDLKVEPENINLVQGDILTEDQLVVTAVYEDGSEVRISDFVSDLEEQDQTIIGTKSFYVTYEERGIKKNVNVTFRVIRDTDVRNYTVAFDTGCDIYIEPQTVLHNDMAEVPGVQMTKEGYTFAGWYNGETQWDFDKKKVTEDVVLTARWSKLNLIQSDDQELYVYTENIGNYEYTGKNITPSPVVVDAKLNVLKKGTDYTIKYNNNKAISAPGMPAEIIITAKGSYTGVITVPFEIVRKDISAAEDISITTSAYLSYKASGYTPVPAVKHGSKALKKDVNFSVAYYRYEEAGSSEKIPVETLPIAEPGYYCAEVTGIGDYIGTRTVDFEIGQQSQINLKSVSVKLGSAASKLFYTGETVYVNDMITVTAGTTRLYEGSDYVLVYPENHTDTGKITVTVKAVPTGRAYGEKTFTYQINGLPLKSAQIALAQSKVTFGKEVFDDNIASVTYKVTKSNQAAFAAAGYSVTVNDEVNLVKDRDYSVSYTNSEKAGTAAVEITGKGLFTGTVKKTFSISKMSLTGEQISCSVTPKVEQNKAGAKPTVILAHTVDGRRMMMKEGVDYTVQVSSNKTVTEKAKVTIKGKGNYTGTLTRYFEIVPKKLRSTDITVSVPNLKNGMKKDTYVYKPTVTMYDNGVKLSTPKEYIVDYSSCLTQAQVNAGEKTGTVIVGAAGKAYTGAVMVTYRVADASIAAKNCSITIADQLYTGKAVTFDTDQVEDAMQFTARYTDSDGTVHELKPGQDFEIVSYQNNIKAGTAKAVLQGIGSYTGTKTVTFKITKRPIS